MKKAETGKKDWAGWALIGLIGLYIVTFSFVASLKYQSFSFQDMDLAAINQAVWNASRGHLISRQPGESVIFSGHKWVIIFPLLPVYILFPGPLTLLFLQSLALGLGAGAIYLIGRELLSRRFGLVFAFCYLIYPALNYANLYEFHPVAFATPLLLFAFYFYLKQKWGLFILFIALSLASREDVAIPVFGMGLFALLRGGFQKKEKFWLRFRWGLLPVFLALFWFMICTKIAPVKSTTAVESFYSWLGGSPGEIMKNLVLHPGIVLQGVIIKPKLLYLLHLFVPLGFLSLLSPSALVMVLVALAEGLLSQRFTHFSIRYQYSSIITPFVFVSALYGVRNILNWKVIARNKSVLKSVSVFVSLFILIFAFISAIVLGPLPHLPDGIRQWRVTREDGMRKKLTGEIPSEIPVITTFEFAPRLSLRPKLFFFYHPYAVSRHPNFRPNISPAQKFSRYALVDFNDWLTFYDFYTPGGDRDIQKFLRAGNWQLKTTVNSLALFEKGDEPALGLVEEIAERDNGNLPSISGIPQLQFAGFSTALKSVLGEPVISLSVDLKCLRKIDDDLLLIARFSPRTDRAGGFQQFFFAPYRIYPTSRWKPGSVVRQSCNILLPENYPEGAYDLTLTLIRKRPNLPFSPEAGNLFYNYYDTAMAIQYLPGRWGISPGDLLEQKVVAHIPDAVKLP